jgi:antitoxin VapB
VSILNIKDPRAHEIASRIARITNESLTEVVLHSLEERLNTLRSRETPIERYTQTLEWLRTLQTEPIVDTRSEDEILGYDDIGLPR